jgi:peptide/nickel transport system permease protein
VSDQTVDSAVDLALEQPVKLVEGAPGRARFALLRDALRLGRTRVGLAIVTVLVLVALAGPLVAPYSPTEFVGIPNSPPSGDAIFGTDALGRDVFSRFLYGGRTVLWLSAAATLLGVTLGVVVGLIAAYARNWLDDVLMRGNDVLLAFPQIIFVLLAVSALGPKLWLIVLTVGLTHAPRVARVIRGAALEIVERDFVKSAEVVGEARWRVVFAEVLPNVTSPLLVEVGLRMTYSIGLIAGISFLGFGLQPPDADWGLMINENRLSITVQPWAVLLPVIAIGLLTIGTNLITDGVSRALAGIDRKADS